MSRWQYLNIWTSRTTNYWRPCTAAEAARYCTSGIKVRLIGEPVTTDTIFDLAAPDADVAPAMPLMFQFQYINQDGHVCTKTIPIDGAVIEDGQMVLSFTEPIHRPKQFFMSDHDINERELAEAMKWWGECHRAARSHRISVSECARIVRGMTCIASLEVSK
jgi:hypothetical protein